MRRAKKFVINAAILTATALLVRIVSVSFGVYIANRIGAEGVGVFQLITSVYLFAITLATSGIHLTTTRLVTEELAQNRPATAQKALHKCLVYSLFFSCCAGVLLFISAPRITCVWLHNKISARPFYVLSFSLPPLAVSCVFSGYFTALRNATKNASSQILKQCIKVLVTVFLLKQTLQNGLDAACLALVLGDVAAEILTFLYLAFVYLLSRRRSPLHAQSHPGLTRKMFGICLPIALSSYVRSALVTLKQVMIPDALEKSGATCEAALSQYGLIGGMVMPVLMFPSVFLSAVSLLLIPEISEKHVRQKKEQIQHILSRIFKITLLFSVCISGLLFAFADPLSRLLYQNSDAALYIRLLSPLIILMYFDEIVDAILKGLNQQVRVVGINILDTLVGIFMIYTFIPHCGILGYVAVIIVTETLNAALSIRRLCRVTQFRIDYLAWVVIPGLCIAISVFIVRLLPSLFLPLKFLLSLFLYLALLWVSGTISKKDFVL